MAGPQLENGFTQIANELLEVIMRTNFNATQLKILLCIIRFTYGFQRKSHYFSINFIANSLGVSKRTIGKELINLINADVLSEVEKYTAKKERKLQINKKYNQWQNFTISFSEWKQTSTVEDNFRSRVEAEFHRGVEAEFHSRVEAGFHQEINNKINNKENINKYIAHSHEQNISDEKAPLNNDLEKYFDEIWKLYPLKKGKGRISTTKKKQLYKLGDEIKRCISRYIAHVENERNRGFKDLRYQDGSRFFSNGYIDFLDENFQELESMEEKNISEKMGEL